MALPCAKKDRIYTFNGNEYGYNEFRALMYDGLLERVPELTSAAKETLATEEGKAKVEEEMSRSERIGRLRRREAQEMQDASKLDDVRMKMRERITEVMGRMSEERAKAIAKAIAPKLKVVFHDTMESISAAHPKGRRVRGFYDSENQTIHVGPKGNLTHIIAHELLHPVLDDFIGVEKSKVADLYDELVSDERLLGFAEFGKLYLEENNVLSEDGQYQAKYEALVDYLGAVADGKFDKELLGSKFRQAIDELIYKLLNIIGIAPSSVDIKDAETLKDLAELIATASRYGLEVSSRKKGAEKVAETQEMRADEAFNGIEEPKTPIGDTKTVVVDGVERTVFNSEGRPIHPTVEGVRNFWRWFGDSKVVDAEGRPLVVYHKTRADIEKFDKDKIGASDYGYAGRGFYFMPFPLSGLTYGDITMPVYLSLKNPYIRNNSNWKSENGPYLWIAENSDRLGGNSEASKAWTEMMKLNDFDGFMDKAGKGDGEIVAFDSTQIKSATGNYGRFDPTKGEISEMRSEEEKKLIPSDEFNKAIDAADEKTSDISDQAWNRLTPEEQATRVADAAVASMKQSDWFKGLGIKEQRAALTELRSEVSESFGVKLAPKTQKQQERAEEAAFKLGQKLGKQEEAERNRKLMSDFAEFMADQKAKTKAEKDALEQKYLEKFGKYKEEAAKIIKEQKSKLKEAAATIKGAVSDANEAVSKAIKAVSAARKAGKAEGMKTAEKMQKDMAAAVVATIKQAKMDGKLSFAQARMLMAAAAKVNYSNMKSLERFMNLLDKVTSDVAYATKISKIRKDQKQIRKNIQPADASRVKAFAAVNARNIDDNLLDEYHEALKDLNRDVPRLAKMNAIYAKIVTDRPKKQADYKETLDKINKLLESLDELEVLDVDTYREAIKLVASARNKVNDALLSGVIDEETAEELLETLPETQEKFDKKFAKEVKAIKEELANQIAVSSSYIDTSNMTKEEQELVNKFLSLNEEQINSLSPFDLAILAELSDVMATEGTVHVRMLAGVVAKASTMGEAQRVAEQIMAAEDLEMVKGGWEASKVRLAAKRSVAFWESALGLGRIKAGAVRKFIISKLSRASVDSEKFVNNASEVFMKLRDKYDITPSGPFGRGADPMIKLGMIMTYLQEYDLGQTTGNPEYGNRDWFSKAEMEKYVGKASDPKKIAAMKEFWEQMPKDENGNVSPKAVWESFTSGSTKFLTKNELGFLQEILAWKEQNVAQMQRFANHLRGKPFNEIMYHMPRLRLDANNQSLPTNQFFGVSKNKISIESLSGKERKDNRVGPVEVDFTRLFINNVDQVAVDYYYTQAVMEVNDILASAQKLIKDKQKGQAYINAIRQVSADAINYEFSHARFNKFIRRALTVRSVGILFGPLRPLQELITALFSIPFRTGSPLKVYKRIGKSVLEYEQWFKKNEFVLDIMEKSKSDMTSRDGFNKIYEFKRSGYDKKSFFEKLAFAIASLPERTQINVSWEPIFMSEFKREAGVEFDVAAYKLNPNAYFNKHRQAFLAAAASADNNYQKIIGPSTQFGARRVQAIGVATNTNLGMLVSWMSNWPARAWWQLRDSAAGFANAEREAMMTGYEPGDIRTEAAAQALGVLNETLMYSFLTNFRILYGKAMLTTIAVLASSAIGDEDDEEKDRKIDAAWDEANKEALAGLAPANILMGSANSMISLATSPLGSVGREAYGLTVNLLYSAAKNRQLGLDRADEKFLKQYMESQMFRFAPSDMGTKYGTKAAVGGALVNSIPVIGATVDKLFAIQDAYGLSIDKIADRVARGEELTVEEKEVYAIAALTINLINTYGMVAGGVALPFEKEANQLMKDMSKGRNGLMLREIPFGSTVNR